tara:strand:+ start:2462 stop:2590 length:129 start_codon:yes stop_codon:yes gene_type:complete
MERNAKVKKNFETLSQEKKIISQKEISIKLFNRWKTSKRTPP